MCGNHVSVLKQSRCLDKIGHKYGKYYINVTGVMRYLLCVETENVKVL